MTLRILTLALTIAAASSACFDSEPPATSAPPVSARASEALVANEDATPIASGCRALLTRERECSSVVLPALVAARVAHDLPQGIAARDAQLGREALLREAFDEYADDSKDEAIAATCSDIVQHLSKARAESLSARSQAAPCNRAATPSRAARYPSVSGAG